MNLPQLLREAYKPIASAEDANAKRLVRSLIAHGHYPIAETLVKIKK